ncbi:MAG: oxygenase MpaB family protein [Nostoc sp. DedQUE04]|uniref:oxygenase MpaB family protein n=1 Tax=Nostoc sp. DedQUE04 TaxID=3075390 RepID=UPI002AD212B8|nr:oxygenase MpaB family protein [Nostoc sp. DedQUE04]MDZ8135822.1 oxygenase MpaB family protein [Nostoc sp. DedQUE04]
MLFNRYKNLHLIQQLDPVIAHCQIYSIMIGYDFSWEMTRALEVALMRTYCVPSISKLLDKTGEFYQHSQKRYDDTGIIIGEIGKWGYDSDRGKEAMQRMNAIHGRFKINNADFLYVLSTFIYDPIRWNASFGWRLMCEQEKLAAFYFWREVGKRMHIQNIPETYAEFERYNRDYEQANFRYSDTNRRVGEATRNLFLSWFPGWMSFALKPLVYALLDDVMLDAFGFEHPSPFLRSLLANILKIRARLLRYFPPRNQPYYFIDHAIRSYPDGYKIANVGPAENSKI